MKEEKMSLSIADKSMILCISIAAGASIFGIVMIPEQRNRIIDAVCEVRAADAATEASVEEAGPSDGGVSDANNQQDSGVNECL